LTKRYFRTRKVGKNNHTSTHAQAWIDRCKAQFDWLQEFVPGSAFRNTRLTMLSDTVITKTKGRGKNKTVTYYVKPWAA
jgi:hypothetical protein